MCKLINECSRGKSCREEKCVLEVINPATGSVEYVWHLGFTAINKPEARPNYYYDNLELATTACF